jgi:hypothetical protein
MKAAKAIAEFVRNGGGLVTSSFALWFVSRSTLVSNLQPVVPVGFSTTVTYCSTTDDYWINFVSLQFVDYLHYSLTSILKSDNKHPLAADLSSEFSINSYCIFSGAGLTNGAQSAAQVYSKHFFNFTLVGISHLLKHRPHHAVESLKQTNNKQ